MVNTLWQCSNCRSTTDFGTRRLKNEGFEKYVGGGSRFCHGRRSGNRFGGTGIEAFGVQVSSRWYSSEEDHKQPRRRKRDHRDPSRSRSGWWYCDRRWWQQLPVKPLGLSVRTNRSGGLRAAIFLFEFSLFGTNLTVAVQFY
jgi:hypothetical protein